MRKTALGITLALVFLAATFLIGGDPASGTTAAENSWETKAANPDMEGGSAAVVNGRIHVMGGELHYEYNPSTNTWTARTPMPTPRRPYGIVSYKDKIYVIGGSTGWTQEKGTLYSSANEVYDPSTGTWETKKAMPTVRGSFQASVVSGKIHLIANDVHDVYDVATDSWSAGKPMPISYPAYVASSTVFDGRIHLMGGDETQVYDPASDSWSLGAASPVRVSAPGVCATTGVMALKRIYVFGGTVGFLNETAVTQVYDPENDSWTLGASMPTARTGPATAVVDDVIYVIGGGYGWGYSANVNEQYIPFGYGTPDPSYVPPVDEIPSEPFPMVPLVATASFLAAGAGLLLYRRKCRREAAQP